MIGRKIAEVIIFSIVGALVAPTLASVLAHLVMDQVNQVYTVPMAAVALIILSFLISTFIKWALASFMSINMDHILVMGAIFILQFFICAIFIFFGMKFVFAAAVVAGSFISLVITIVRRPFTAYSEVKDKIEEYQHPGDHGKRRKH